MPRRDLLNVSLGPRVGLGNVQQPLRSIVADPVAPPPNAALLASPLATTLAAGVAATIPSPATPVESTFSGIGDFGIVETQPGLFIILYQNGGDGAALAARAIRVDPTVAGGGVTLGPALTGLTTDTTFNTLQGFQVSARVDALTGLFFFDFNSGHTSSVDRLACIPLRISDPAALTLTAGAIFTPTALNSTSAVAASIAVIATGSDGTVLVGTRSVTGAPVGQGNGQFAQVFTVDLSNLGVTVGNIQNVRGVAHSGGGYAEQTGLVEVNTDLYFLINQATWNFFTRSGTTVVAGVGGNIPEVPTNVGRAATAFSYGDRGAGVNSSWSAGTPGAPEAVLLSHTGNPPVSTVKLGFIDLDQGGVPATSLRRTRVLWYNAAKTRGIIVGHQTVVTTSAIYWTWFTRAGDVFTLDGYNVIDETALGVADIDVFRADFSWASVAKTHLLAVFRESTTQNFYAKVIAV